MNFTEYNCDRREHDYFKLLDPIKKDLKNIDISKLITYGKVGIDGKSDTYWCPCYIDLGKVCNDSLPYQAILYFDIGYMELDYKTIEDLFHSEGKISLDRIGKLSYRIIVEVYEGLNVLYEPNTIYLFEMPLVSEEYIKENLGEEIYNYISISTPNIIKRMLTFHLEKYFNNKTKEEIKNFINKIDI
mgnify:CR=1 FL=1